MAEAEHSESLFTDDIRDLLRLMSDGDIAEVHIKRGDSEVHVKRTQTQPQVINMVAAAPHAAAPNGTVPASVIAQPASSPTPLAVNAVAEEEPTNGVTITAPMVGTYYASATPKDPPYVHPGDEVRPGDVLGIIEAMKIMNEIECEILGRVTSVLVTNGQPVEYGQPLMIIEPL
jgi:acetyl-CoA carboxylase biotin carboxyl carrier protein